ncbi:DUF6527 family protein [Shewanella chilikensis]|uniref:DUF6527 family protein n=1 Tax=Shewanella TaxID=22 RepID=UPI00399AAB78
MAILEKTNNEGHLIFYCPGCDCPHSITVSHSPVVWSFNGDFDCPSFSPSYLAVYNRGESFEECRCHCFIRDGEIQYLSDCTHHLANKTVPMVDINKCW